jgi:hypothetical protein
MNSSQMIRTLLGVQIRVGNWRLDRFSEQRPDCWLNECIGKRRRPFRVWYPGRAPVTLSLERGRFIVIGGTLSDAYGHEKIGEVSSTKRNSRGRRAGR